MSNHDLGSEVRHALAAFADEPPPTGLAAAAIRTARRQRRMHIAVASVAVVAALAVTPMAISAASGAPDTSYLPASGGMEPLVIAAYSGRNDGSRLLDYATGEYLELPYRVVVPSPDGTRALVHTGDNSSADPLRVGVMDTATLEVRWIAGHYGPGAWSPDGREILLTERGEVDRARVGFAIVDAETLESRFVPQPDINDAALNVEGHRYVWAPDGEQIVLSQSTGEDRESEADLTWGLRFYDRDGTLLRSMPTSGPVQALGRSDGAFSPDGTRLAIFNSHTGGPIEILDRATGAVLLTVQVPGWQSDDWGDLVGWAGDQHLLVRNPLPGGEALADDRTQHALRDFNLLVVNLAGEVVQEVELLGWWEELVVASSEWLNPDAAELTFGAP